MEILHPYDEIQEQTDVRACSRPFAQWKQIENTPEWHADLPGNISVRLKIKSDHEYILCYQKDAEELQMEQCFIEKQLMEYKLKL